MSVLRMPDVLVVGDDLTVIDQVLAEIERDYDVREASTIEGALLAVKMREPAVLAIACCVCGLEVDPLLVSLAALAPSARRLVHFAATEVEHANMLQRLNLAQAIVPREQLGLGAMKSAVDRLLSDGFVPPQPFLMLSRVLRSVGARQ